MTASTSASRDQRERVLVHARAARRRPPRGARRVGVGDRGDLARPRTSLASRRTCVGAHDPAADDPDPTQAPSSDGGREVHVAAVVAGVLRLLGPAARDRLAARVEAHALGPVDVVVAEQRVLPAAEASRRPSAPGSGC